VTDREIEALIYQQTGRRVRAPEPDALLRVRLRRRDDGPTPAAAITVTDASSDAGSCDSSGCSSDD
jgi:hypothetical protein